jgi:2-polyprenyl-3-methyl-5-hydroxy-6-metoxy-1,4-benzoquinol methylase
MATSAASRRLKRMARLILPGVAGGPVSQHNMNEDGGELYYLEQYLNVLAPLLAEPSRVLDVGCQYGRLAIPLAAAGHHVVGTEVDVACLDYLRERCPAVELRHEAAVDTARAVPAAPYGLVLVLELLYLMPDWRDLIAGLARQVAPNGHLAGSHRSHGYVIHRLLRDGRYDELDEVLAGAHPTLNAQTPAELRDAYEAAGLRVLGIHPVGAFSGIHVDPFAALCDPARLTAKQRQRLARYETDPALGARFLESARYLLVVATPHS